ncbi:MAG: rRNA methyltransferase, partial [Erysipelotrichaceae bacterium]|nr:rRNA methyltransferase [Erysipelotrichaceae bacterium]
LDELEKLQLELLHSIKELVKIDGIVLYSTCTLNRKENDRLIRKFLSEEGRFELLEEDTIINEAGDAFYYAKIKRVKE